MSNKFKISLVICLFFRFVEAFGQFRKDPPEMIKVQVKGCAYSYAHNVEFKRNEELIKDFIFIPSSTENCSCKNLTLKRLLEIRKENNYIFYISTPSGLANIMMIYKNNPNYTSIVYEDLFITKEKWTYKSNSYRVRKSYSEFNAWLIKMNLFDASEFLPLVDFSINSDTIDVYLLRERLSR